MCNQDKQPITIHGGEYLVPPAYHYAACKRLRWKEEPGDHITTLSRIDTALEAFCNSIETFGFGIMLSIDNSIVCYDFDHCIAPDGSIPDKIRDFLEELDTFVEISSSGTGLHAFCCTEGETSEYDFKKDFCDGKCYDKKRFIKLTGNVFENYDRPIKFLDEQEFNDIRTDISVIAPEPCSTGSEHIKCTQNGTYHAHGNGITDWPRILSASGIRFEVIPNYKDKKSPKHGRISKFACKVQCPQAHLHTDYHARQSEFNPDVAVLSLWDDGTTSLKCGHNHCSPIYRPNLLQKLWTQIKVNSPIAKKRAKLRELLKSHGVL
jgi:hypothetical protein